MLFLFFLLFSFDTEIILELCRIFFTHPMWKAIALNTPLPGGGGGGLVILFSGGGVPPGPENPYPISDQDIRFSIPYFRPDSQKKNVYPFTDPVMCGKFGNSQ